MLKHINLTERRIAALVTRIEKLVYTQLTPLECSVASSAEPLTFRQARKAKYRPIRVGSEWGSAFDCAWFKFRGRVPQSFAGQKVVALIDIAGEGCLFDSKGNPVLGLTGKQQAWEKTPRTVAIKKRIDLPRAKPGEAVELLVDAGANNLWGASEPALLRQADLAVFRPDAFDLLMDASFLRDLMHTLEEHSRHRALLRFALNEAANAIGDGSPECVRRCRQILAPELSRRANASALEVSAVGHAHIDVAWLWPLRETVRKCARTFSTALALIEEYPEYIFGASQPHLYQMVKDNYPRLYERIRRAVKAGRWECQGGMWVEADANLSSGESLVRQVLHGKRFYRREFGVEVDNLWLPDVFGYSAALPQIMLKSGLKYFLTQKMSWNQFNKFPHHTFIWRGLDGSEVFAHFPPANTYNASGWPENLAKCERSNLDADRTDHAMLLFGIGDGGGGPGREYIERLRRARDLEDLPRVRMEAARKFFTKAVRSARSLCKWEGELYLEIHRGTLTSQAMNKRYNRKLELKLREAEGLLSLSSLGDYPREELDELWKIILLNQFHDIIPGSSIGRVYEESRIQYRDADRRLEAMLNEGEAKYARQVKTARPGGIVVRNSLSWTRADTVTVESNRSAGGFVDQDGRPLPSQPTKIDGRRGHLVAVKVPPMGHATIYPADRPAAAPASPLKVSERLLENDLLRIEFHADGTIRGIFDKKEAREVVADGEAANVFRLYEDLPINWEAWDVDLYYKEVAPASPELESVRVVENGPVRASLEMVYRAERCTISQRVSLEAASRRIDFVTHVDWREHHKMLRVEFPLNVMAEQATYEIQYGHVRRPTHGNTSWDMARFEVLGHKWADLSQHNYGVALLNDCKYGHNIWGHTISLNLLRAPAHPDPGADRHEHDFTYSLLPHAGNHIAGKVIQRAYELNVPMRAIGAGGPAGRGKLPQVHSFMDTGCENVVVEAVKKSEDGDDLIIRLYEAAGCDCRTDLTLNLPVARVAEVDLMEEHPRPLTMRAGRVALSFGPFEIKTLRLKLRPPGMRSK